MLLRDAGAWELVNIPVDDAIDLFDSLHEAIAKSELEKKVTFDHLFHWVKEYTMEELGVWDFYEIFEACACMKLYQKFDSIRHMSLFLQAFHSISLEVHG